MRFILTATGAKSGKPRTVALLGIPHPDGVPVVAANYGDAKHPAWYHKLKANPAATVVKCQWVSATSDGGVLRMPSTVRRHPLAARGIGRYISRFDATGGGPCWGGK